MSKVTSKPGTMLYPVPTVMVSCGDGKKTISSPSAGPVS